MSHINFTTIEWAEHLDEINAEVKAASERAFREHWNALAPALAMAWAILPPIRKKIRGAEILTKEEQVCLFLCQEAIHAGLTPWHEWPEGKEIELSFDQIGSFEYVGTPFEGDELKHCFVRRVGFIRHDGRVVVKPVLVEGQPDD